MKSENPDRLPECRKQCPSLFRDENKWRVIFLSSRRIFFLVNTWKKRDWLIVSAFLMFPLVSFPFLCRLTPACVLPSMPGAAPSPSEPRPLPLWAFLPWCRLRGCYLLHWWMDEDRRADPPTLWSGIVNYQWSWAPRSAMHANVCCFRFIFKPTEHTRNRCVRCTKLTCWSLDLFTWQSAYGGLTTAAIGRQFWLFCQYSSNIWEKNTQTPKIWLQPAIPVGLCVFY